MAKRIVQPSYRFGDERVEPMPYFLYEISIYKITKDGIGIFNSKFVKSDKLLNIKKEVVYKNYKGFQIIKCIDLRGVPLDFIKENNLPIYEPFKKKKQNERTHRNKK